MLRVQVAHPRQEPAVLLGAGTRRVREPSRNTHWPTPVSTDTSIGWETRRGIVGSSETSSRRSREERRGRFNWSVHHHMG